MSCTDQKELDMSLVTVEDLTYQLLPSGARIVSGMVNNPTDSDVGSIQVQVSLFDKDNVRVDGLSILVRDIGANSKVSFREPVDSDFDVTAARVKGMIRL
jgi:hypothetical protein